MNEPKHVVIILNSPLPARERMHPWLQRAAMIIAADGGANRAAEAGIAADVVVGDLDSLSAEVKKSFAPGQLILRPSQYATDFEKALEFALEQNARQATIFGLSGGRLDHQITNLNIFERFSERLELTAVDAFGTGRIIRSRTVLHVAAGTQISLAAFRRCSGITTTGLKYPLREATMEWSINNGQSNEAVAGTVTIDLREGSLFLYVADALTAEEKP